MPQRAADAKRLAELLAKDQAASVTRPVQ